jgi:YVTN family beta-propeller protein
MVRLAFAIGASVLALAACSPTTAELPAPPAIADPAMAGQLLFVTNKGEDTLSKVDLAKGKEVQRVPSCTTPHELAVSPDGNHVALGCYGGRSITIFRTSDLAEVKQIELGEGAKPHGIVWHPSGTLYATAEGRKAIYRIADPMGDAPVLTEFMTGQDGTHMLAVAPDELAAWTVNMVSGTVSRVDLTGTAAALTAEMGKEPEGIAVTPDGKTLWISARGSNAAFALDPATLAVKTQLGTGRFPLRLAISPQGDVAVTSDLYDGGLTVIDLATATKKGSIPVSGKAQAEARFQVTILWSADGSRLYVAETGTNTVAEVDYASGKVLRRFMVGEDGDGLAIVTLPGSGASGA